MQKLLSYLKGLRPSAPLLVLVSYLLLLFSRYLDTGLLTLENSYLLVVVLQILIFLLPASIFILYQGDGYLESLRLSLPKPQSLLLTLFASLFLLSGGLLLSILFSGENDLPGTFTLYETFLSHNTGSFGSVLYLILAYAALPAVAEELVFRAILLREYEKKGAGLAILASSILFTLLHFRFRGFPVYFFAGIVLALTAYLTRSVLSSILAHFLYNLFGLFGQPYISTFYRITGSTVLFTFALVFLFLLSAALFSGEAARLTRIYARTSALRLTPREEELESKSVRIKAVFFDPAFLLSATVALAATAAITFF